MYTIHMPDWNYIHNVYESDIPAYLRELIQCPSLQRIDGVDMNCGMQYSSFPLFLKIHPYSRLQHSIGVALIVEHFTHSAKQSIAGLLHDISTPVFSHVIDFLMHDYEHQEYTESNISEILKQDKKLMDILRKYNISLEDVQDYHMYPIADSDTPKLSADRLEYTLCNMVNYGFASADDIAPMYNDLCVGKNEYGEEEIVFQHEEYAKQFSRFMWQCAHVYVADEDRYGMEYLARILKGMMERETCTRNDFYTTEEEFLKYIAEDAIALEQFHTFQSFTCIRKCSSEESGALCVHAKKRYIDPYVLNQGRLSSVDIEMENKIAHFKNLNFEYYIKGYKE